MPLRSGDDLIGLVAVSPERGRMLTENEESLLRALAAQLAVAVQNAQLHEKVERESGEAKRARDEALAASRRLHALYEISRAFTESLSLKKTLDAVVQTIVEALETAISIVGPAALALENARLHQEREEFTETMRRSLLPRNHPQLPGLEIGAVYEPATRVEIGGDV